MDGPSDDVGGGLEDGTAGIDLTEEAMTHDVDGQTNGNNDDDGNGNNGSPKDQGNLAVEVESSAAPIDGDETVARRSDHWMMKLLQAVVTWHKTIHR